MLDSKKSLICKVRYDRVLSMIITLVIIFSITGCENKGYNKKIVYNVTSYADFIKALQDRGYTAKETKPSKKEASKSFFSVNSRDIIIGNEIVSVYEFKNSETAKSEADTISKDGSSIDNKKTNFSGTPHFFQKGNLIVVYIGSSTSIIFDLSMILNNSITG